jgi:thioredoxin-related protein
MLRMKRALLLLMSVTALSVAAIAGDKDKKSAEKAEINWMTLDQVQAAMKKEPRKVLIDFYTSWCGWCKVMDRKTYSNPEIVKYVNEKFYAVKFDAEQRDTVLFLGKTYAFKPENRTNEFAMEVLGGQLSYPTTVFMTENFQNPSAVAGYQNVQMMETILKFLGENKYQTTKWEDHQKEYKPGFKELPEEPGTAPAKAH